MESFIEFCAGTRLAKAIKSWKKPPKRPVSPIADENEQDPGAIERLYSEIECGNLLCIESTENASRWKQARVRDRLYYLCSDSCYKTWLNSPQYHSFSPSVPAKPRKDPPPMEL